MLKRLIILCINTRFSFSGASSTSGDNILLDLSDTFEDPDNDFQYDKEKNIIKIGISFSLKQERRNINYTVYLLNKTKQFKQLI